METSAFNEGEVIPSVQPLSRVIAFSAAAQCPSHLVSETKWLGHWAAALVALGWVARVIGVGRPMALGRLLMAMGAPEAYLCQWDCYIPRLES